MSGFLLDVSRIYGRAVSWYKRGEQTFTRFGPWGATENGLEPIGGHDTSQKGVKKETEGQKTVELRILFRKGRETCGENLQMRSRMDMSLERDQVPGAKDKRVPRC